MGMAAMLVTWPKPFEQIFIPLSHGVFTWNVASICQAVSNEKKFENVNLSDQGQWMTLTFDIHIDSCSYLVNLIYQLWHWYSEICIVLPFSHKKA